MEFNKRRVSYYFDRSIGDYYYGSGHPMKPNRVRMTNSLVEKYGLFNKMRVVRPYLLSNEEMSKFHDSEYIDFLENVTVSNQKTFERESFRFLGKSEHSDNPIFDGIFEFCQTYCGGSVSGAIQLNHHETDVAINWSGGFHHAKRNEAAGFCYVNDIVLAIIELLKFHNRVMYIDIDVHHGDGVEEAFYCSDRVLTASFHKGGDFFPGTGHVEDVGSGDGLNYAVNVPLEEGIDDETFFDVFAPIIDASLARYRPEAIVLQCGSDSLAGDRLGCFNLTDKGHGRCVRHVISKSLPTLVLGGGGYTIGNVSRCWAYETALCLGEKLTNELPDDEYKDYYAPDYQLHIAPSHMQNLNTRAYIENLKATVLENLRRIEIAPSQQLSPSLQQPKDNSGNEYRATFPRELNGDRGEERDVIVIDDDEEEDINGDLWPARVNGSLDERSLALIRADRRIENEGEFMPDEDFSSR